MASKGDLFSILHGSGQEHILNEFDALATDEQAFLGSQVASYTNAQWKHLNNILADSLCHLSNSAAPSVDGTAEAEPRIVPPPAATILDWPKLLDEKSEELAKILTAGMGVIARGEGAVLLMAGGSGTRLGVTIPKGLFQCDLLPSGRSLFEYQCLRIRRMEQLADIFAQTASLTATPNSSSAAAGGRGLIPLLVMTSNQNDAATQSFFREHHFFGLLPEQVIFFRQSSLPCYEEKTGKVLMEAKGKICVAPGGNGSVYESLARAVATIGDAPSASASDLSSRSSTPSLPKKSAMAHLVERGVRYVQIFSVDNLLAKLGDACFYGVAAVRQAEVVVKTVPKVSAEERVGVFALTDGEWSVVEYTEIGKERAAQIDPLSGELAYNCGNIASHCCSVDFLALAAEHMATNTFYHAARKNIPTINGVAPAVKMEAFLFDEFRLAREVPTRRARQQEKDGDTEEPDAFQIVQVSREAEFAPIKNADGAAADTPTTAAHLLLNLHTKWVEAAIAESPATVPDSGSSAYTAEERALALQRLRDGTCQWEITPLVSYEGEGLAAYVPQLIHRSVTDEGVLGLEENGRSRSNM